MSLFSARSLWPCSPWLRALNQLEISGSCSITKFDAWKSQLAIMNQKLGGHLDGLVLRTSTVGRLHLAAAAAAEPMNIEFVVLMLATRPDSEVL